MSQLEVNSIDKYSGNNLLVGSQLNLKSYTTTQRDALTSVAGDTIYNSTTNQPQYYNGSSWNSMVAPQDVAITYLSVGGGGGAGSTSSSSGRGSGGAGGGGFLSTTNTLKTDTNYTFTVGAGGNGGAAGGFNEGTAGSDTKIVVISPASTIVQSYGGGYGGGQEDAGGAGGSGGGSGDLGGSGGGGTAGSGSG